MVVMTPEIRDFMREPTLLIVIKANVSSRVHRRIHGLCGHQALYADGRLEGELRVVGLFTSGAYTRSVRQIPYVRHKVSGCFSARASTRAAIRASAHAYSRRVSA